MSHSTVNDWEEINEWDGEEELDQRLSITTVHSTTVLDDDYDGQANNDEEAFEYIEAHDRPTYSNVAARSRRAARQARKQKKVGNGPNGPANDEDVAVHSEPERGARPLRTRSGVQSDPEDHQTSVSVDVDADGFPKSDTRRERSVHSRMTHKERNVKRLLRLHDLESLTYSRGDNNRDPTFCFIKACKKSERSAKLESSHLRGVRQGKRDNSKKFVDSFL